MKSNFRFICALVAIIVILGSISFSNFVKAEEFSVETANSNQYSIKTTNATGEVVNGNVHPYETKLDVYVRIDGNIPESYYVRVKSPQGSILGTSGELNYDSHFNLYEETKFDDTDNNGGEYKVEVSLSDSFKNSETKSDNFKIKKLVKAKIIVEKIVEDHNNIKITDDNTTFTFELFKIEGANSSSQGTITIIGNGTNSFKELEDGTYKVCEINTPVEYDPSDDVEVTITNRQDAIVSFTNKKNTSDPPDTTWKQGKIIVTKLKWGLPGRYGIALPQSPKDITFRLEGENIEPMELTTGRTGIIVFENLPEGNYTLIELVPEGYTSSIPENGYQIEIVRRKLNLPIPILVNNFQQPVAGEMGSIIVEKLVFDEEIPLDDISGFTFKLYKIVDGDEILINEKTTGIDDIDGLIIFDTLSNGEYIIREDSKEGYISNNTEDPIIIDDNYKNVNVVITNTKLPQWTGTIIIHKSIKTNLPTTSDIPRLSGFIFELYQDGIRVKDPISTDPDGIAQFKGLYPGKYEIKEVPTEGYTTEFKNGNTVTIEKNDDTKTWYLDVINHITEDNGGNGDPPPPNGEEPPINPPIDDEDDIPPPPTDIEEEEIIEDDTPEIIPDEIIEDEEEEIIIEEDVPVDVPEIEVIPEEVPESVPTLPKTGAASDLVLYGLGSLFIGLGAFLRKKKNK